MCTRHTVHPALQRHHTRVGETGCHRTELDGRWSQLGAAGASVRKNCMPSVHPTATARAHRKDRTEVPRSLMLPTCSLNMLRIGAPAILRVALCHMPKWSTQSVPAGTTHRFSSNPPPARMRIHERMHQGQLFMPDGRGAQGKEGVGLYQGGQYPLRAVRLASRDHRRCTPRGS
jgi:hypothetical protein